MKLDSLARMCPIQYFHIKSSIHFHCLLRKWFIKGFASGCNKMFIAKIFTTQIIWKVHIGSTLWDVYSFGQTFGTLCPQSHNCEIQFCRTKNMFKRYGKRWPESMQFHKCVPKWEHCSAHKVVSVRTFHIYLWAFRVVSFRVFCAHILTPWFRQFSTVYTGFQWLEKGNFFLLLCRSMSF